MVRSRSSFIDFRSLATRLTPFLGYSHELFVFRLMAAHPLALTFLVSLVRDVSRYVHDAPQCLCFMFVSNTISVFYTALGTVDLGRFSPYFTRMAPHRATSPPTSSGLLTVPPELPIRLGALSLSPLTLGPEESLFSVKVSFPPGRQSQCVSKIHIDDKPDHPDAPFVYR